LAGGVVAMVEIFRIPVCPACHIVVEKDFNFCPYCGSPLNEKRIAIDYTINRQIDNQKGETK